MNHYVVTFFKNLVDSEGHPFKTTQAEIELCGCTPEQAVEQAIERFVEARHVCDWTLHADSLVLSERP
jgi:hypothetical protein